MEGFNWGEVLDYFRTGFNQVNAAQGLGVALIAAIIMRKWVQWPAVTLLAVIVHVVIETAIPIVTGKSEVRLPPLVEPAYWQYLGMLYVGYFIIIGVFYPAKLAVLSLMKRTGSQAGASSAAAPSSPRPAAPPPGKHRP